MVKLNIQQIIEESLREAKKKDDEEITDEGKHPDRSDQQKHRDRSEQFIRAFVGALRKKYEGEKSFRVLSKYNKDHRPEFGLNELLFDILVCDTETTISAVNGVELTFVTRAIWQIESEFAHDSREAIYDFNKLILGSSENKLFIAPQGRNEDAFRDSLEKPAAYCKSNTYLAFVPHPSKWAEAKLDVHCWELDNKWKPI